MRAEFDAHVPVGARDRVRHVVGQRVGANHCGAFVLAALALQSHIARYLDDLAAGLDMRNVAEQDPRLSAGNLVIEAHVVERDFRAMVDLIYALGVDADAGGPGRIVVGQNGVFEIIARQIPLAARASGRRSAIRRAHYPGADRERDYRNQCEYSKQHYCLWSGMRARSIASNSSRTAPRPPRASLIQCAADNTSGCASATAAAKPTAAISGKSGVSSTRQAQARGSMSSRRVRSIRAATLSAQPCTTLRTLSSRMRAVAAGERRPLSVATATPLPIKSLMP